MASKFTPGIELSALFYSECVRPLLDEAYPGLPHSAALIGWGSEVLGFDSPRSADHNWGPRLQVFLPDAAASPVSPVASLDEISAMLTKGLPTEFRGYPTFFPASDAPAGSDRHWVEVAGLGPWLTASLGFNPLAGVTLLDWLATPTQRLAEVTGGAVFHDGLTAAEGGTVTGGLGRGGGADRAGALGRARAALAWYPRDIWLYVLACQWQRIAQEEAFPGRCAETGDDLGAAVVTARLVRDLMRLVLLLQRRYPPYSKWLGTAFGRLPVAPSLLAALGAALSATSFTDRERAICAAYRTVASMHNELGISDPVDTDTRQFYDRPYQVLAADRFASAARKAIGSRQISGLALTGAADQFIDSTDAAVDTGLLRAAVAASLRR